MPLGRCLTIKIYIALSWVAKFRKRENKRTKKKRNGWWALHCLCFSRVYSFYFEYPALKALAWVKWLFAFVKVIQDSECIVELAVPNSESSVNAHMMSFHFISIYRRIASLLWHKHYVLKWCSNCPQLFSVHCYF